jgi:cytochrome c-type biogenesis protein CcsB
MIKIALLFYIFSSIFYFLLLKFRKAWMNKLAFVSVLIGFYINMVFLVPKLIKLGSTADMSIIHIVLYLLAIFIITIFILIELKYKFHISGAIIMPIVILITFVSLFIPVIEKQIDQVLISFWFPIHVMCTLVSYSIFTVTFCVSIGFLIHERELKTHHLSKFYFDLPSLESLDELNYTLISSGIVFLTIGIITGSIWAKDAWGTYWEWEPKQTLALITWLIFIISLHLRMFYGWRGRRTAYIAIIGFIFIIITFIVSNFLIKGLHLFI